MKKLPRVPSALLAIATLTLAACGGGGGSSTAADSGTASSTTTTTTTTADPVSTASAATASALALAAVPAGAGQIAYDVAADIGDTWRITLDVPNNSFTVKVLSTQYGLSDRSGSFTAATVGNVTTYSGTDFSLRVDSRTQAASGNIKLGNRSASVLGSGYVAPELSRLAGTYLLAGTARNLSGGGSPALVIGGLKLAADGTAQVCDGGSFDAAGACTAISGLPAPATVALKFTRDAGTGVIQAMQGTQSFGVVHVHAGDRGAALVIDRFGPNDANVMRVGTFVAVKPATLSAGDTDGTYLCSQGGVLAGRVVAAGSSATITNLISNATHVETLALNQVANGSAVASAPGAATLRVPGEAASEAMVLVPLSSSLAVGVDNGGVAITCTRS